MDTVSQRRTVYRYYDATDHLLYVGCTQDIKKRATQHRYQSPWWKEAVRVTLVDFDEEADALISEQDAIIRESPRYNIQHSLLPRVIEGSPEIARQIREARNFDEFIGLKDAAEMYQRKLGTLRLHVRTGVLAACLLGHSWVTSKDEMRRYVSIVRAHGARLKGECHLPREKPEHMPEREWNVLMQRHAGMTLQQIAGGLGVTRERVRQIESVATRRLASGIESKCGRPPKEQKNA